MTEKERPKASDIPGQKQPYPASQEDMTPAPQTDFRCYKPAGKLVGKAALITGGDSGIGRAVAIAFALEGAKVAIFYNEHAAAEVTRQMVGERGGQCVPIKGDVRDSQSCREAVEKTVQVLGGLNILVNNAAYQATHDKFEDVTEDERRRTFETNIFGYFFMAQAALKYLGEGEGEGDSIINTGSIASATRSP